MARVNGPGNTFLQKAPSEGRIIIFTFGSICCIIC